MQYAADGRRIVWLVYGWSGNDACGRVLRDLSAFESSLDFLSMRAVPRR